MGKVKHIWSTANAEKLILKIAKLDNSEELINTLEILMELMIENENNELSGATYQREFNHGRLNIKVFFDRRNPHD